MLQSLSQRVLMRLTHRRASPFNLLLWLYIYMSATAQAQFTTAYFSAGLDNSSTDLSMKLLRVMFGAVGTSLDYDGFSTSTNPLIAELFRVLNNGVLVMVGFLLIYTLIMTTINLAQDGQQALTGKVSPFVMLRIVAGCTLLVPSFAGYSGIQVLVMNVIVQGIGFANIVWDQAVQVVDTGSSSATIGAGNTNDYVYSLLDGVLTDITNYNSDSAPAVSMDTSKGQLSPSDLVTDITGGMITSPYVNNIGTGATNLKANDIASMQLCILIEEATDKSQYKVKGSTAFPNWIYGCRQQSKGSGTQICSSADEARICCGKWENATSTFKMSPDGKTNYATTCGSVLFPNELKDGANNKEAQAGMIAFQEARTLMANHLANIRIYYAEDDSKANGGYTELTDTGETVLGSSCNTSITSSNISSVQINCGMAASINEIAQSYRYGLLTYFFDDLTYGTATSNLSASTTTDMQNGGWAVAGQYYADMTQYTFNDGEQKDNRTLNRILKRAGHVTYSRGFKNSGTGVAMITNGSYVKYLNGTLDNGNLQIEDNILYEDLGYATMAKATMSGDNFSQLAATLAYQDYASALGQTQSSQDAVSANFSTTNTAQDAAACTAAKYIKGASDSFRGDMPEYLKGSNVLQPWLILEAFGANIDYNASAYGTELQGGGRNPAISTDHAMHNMMISIYMTLEALTGMRVFDKYIGSTGDYKKAGELGDLYTSGCRQAINACSKNVGGSGNGTSFLYDLARKNCLLGLDTNYNITNTSLVGLYGMVFLDQVGSPAYPDPLRSLANMGMVMMKSAVFYYVVTMQQVFETMINLTAINVAITGVVKLALALTNLATLGIAEAFFVGTGALIDALSQMMLSLDKYALELFLPLGSAVAALLFSQGVMLGVYLPFLPFFLYTFGVLGWLISVVEAMVAAPLMALGLTHPEGHDLLGQAEQGMMLLLGVFLRPVATVMGLFLSISMSQAALRLVNYGFMFVIYDYFANMASGMDGSAGLGDKVMVMCCIGLFMVYTYLAYAILELSFALIYTIPDRITKYIGGQDAQSDAASMSKAIAGQTKGMADQGASAAGSAVKTPSVSQGGAQGINVGGAKDSASSNSGGNSASAGTGSAGAGADSGSGAASGSGT